MYRQSSRSWSRLSYTWRHERNSDSGPTGSTVAILTVSTLNPTLSSSHCPRVDSASDLDFFRLYILRLPLLSPWVVPGCSGFPERVTRPCVPLLWSRGCSFRYRHAVSVTWLPSSHGMAAFQCRSHAAGGSESSASRGWSADLSSMLARVWSLGGQTTRRWSGRGGSGLREGDGVRC